MAEEKGVWRTVAGRRIFIRDGESLSDSMKRSGKFKGKISDAKSVRKKTKLDRQTEESDEDYAKRKLKEAGDDPIMKRAAERKLKEAEEKKYDNGRTEKTYESKEKNLNEAKEINEDLRKKINDQIKVQREQYGRKRDIPNEQKEQNNAKMREYLEKMNIGEKIEFTDSNIDSAYVKVKDNLYAAYNANGSFREYIKSGFLASKLGSTKPNKYTAIIRRRV